jgi:phosphoenolpyruvate synthase/pyruvate phosphate dikinase
LLLRKVVTSGGRCCKAAEVSRRLKRVCVSKWPSAVRCCVMQDC